jgi:hypothetical protein
MIAAGALSMYLLYPILALDGPGGLIFPILSWPDTYYSSGFSHRKFLKITAGMSKSEVEDLLGPPLATYFVQGTGETGWKYSDTRNDSSYYARVVLFVDGKVTRRLSEFYVD